MEEKIHSIYINNLNERVRSIRLKALLLRECEAYGPVEAVYVGRGIRKRGQAFVAFKHHEDALAACSGLHGRDWFKKPISATIAKSNSDVSLSAEALEARKAARDSKPADPAKSQSDLNAVSATEKTSSVAVPRDFGDPHSTLLLQNIPEEVSLGKLEEIGQKYGGFKECRIFAVKHVGFLEFNSVDEAAAAIDDLCNGNIGTISYAKK